MPKYEFTRLLVTNFKECFRFYRDVMGFNPNFGTENDTYADFENGDVNISLFDKAQMSAVLGTSQKPLNAESQDTICLTFSVENVDEFCAHLQARAVPLLTEPSDHLDWGIRTIHFRDPDGHLIEVNQPLKRDNQ
jgi:catechol 2,3-dioxygenase-like lactoylglutathione lyase family enzyme